MNEEERKKILDSYDEVTTKIINYFDNNYIILHGSFSSTEDNWVPWLKKELEKKNYRVNVPQMPICVGKQNYDNWCKEFSKIPINENTTIIAHSIASVFVCKYLINNKINIKKLIFVSGFNNYLDVNPEFDAVNRPMFIDNLEDIKNYCNAIVCFYSDNDPYVKYDSEKLFADTISTVQHVISNGGHINSESGYTEFKEILKEI